MNCPSCSAEMQAHTLEGHVGTQVSIDLCPSCQVFWFDRFESLRLAPAATLRLFRIIGDCRSTPRPAPDRLACPRCDLRLLATHDRQRNTPFQYWRCPREHGRLISFFDFLREKDFIRPLSPAQIAELRQNVQTINCSNCGAPIDLVHASSCGHCGSPLSMLDVKQIEAEARTLRDAARPRAPIDVAALVEALKAERTRAGRSSPDLVEAGLRIIGNWLD